MEFFSHIDDGVKTYLKDHLKRVAERSREYFYFSQMEEDLKKISYIIGLTHDFGKYTTYFQKRLLGIEYGDKRANHSLISAIFTAYYLDKLKDKFNIVDEVKKYLPLIGFFVVYHHHSDLTSLHEIRDKLEDEETIEVIKDQIKDIKKNSSFIEKELKEIRIDITIDDFQNNLDNIIKNLRKEIYFYKKPSGKADLKEKVSILILSLFSSLIEADKKEAGKVKDPERKNIPENIVEIYKEKSFKNLPKTELNLLREEIFRKVTNKAKTISLSNRIFTFTSPTGSGKTLTGFSFAIKLRNRIKKEFGYTPRIIYSLPFISIIKQNYEVLRNVLSNVEDFKGNSSNYIIEHHHLSNLKYEEGDEFKEVEESLALIESWDSEVVVTTFIQLLHTIIGFKNRFLKKYTKIARSILILDEVQNIPVEYWKLVRDFIRLLTKYLNIYVILMTATKPFIFTKENSTEILPDNKAYFSKFQRIVIKPRLEKEITLEKLKESFISEFNTDKSYLIVLNTIESSIQFFKYLKESIKEIPLYYLSTNITPIERIKRITELRLFLKYKDIFKNLNDAQNLGKSKIEREILKDKFNEFKNWSGRGLNPIVVSTQVIEAGVDLDFDIVYRDIAPLDSIVQVAGRCNREFKKKLGEVYVYLLRKDTGMYASYVYGKISPYISKDIFRNKDVVEERQLPELIDLYFSKIKDAKGDSGKSIFNAFLDLSFYDRNSVSVSEFRLIKEEETFPIFIELNEKAKNVWIEYNDVIRNKEIDKWEKRRRILQIRGEFTNYLISKRIDEKYFKVFEIANEVGLGYVPCENLNKYYDNETGFKIGKLKGVDLIF